MGRLEGKVAVVTGAGRGIGRAIARLFAAEGAKVAVLSRTRADVDDVVRGIEASGGTALGLPTDVSIHEQVAASIDQVAATFGGVNILVNNAFDPDATFAPVAEITRAQLQRNLEMGPFAYLSAMQLSYPYLKACGDGRVLNFGSMSGVVGYTGFAAYNMAKEAVRALTRTAAREWADDKITVNNILPVAQTWPDGTDVPTPANAMGRYGSPEQDIAPVALFLASKDAQFLTGYTLTPDGGWLIDSAR